MTTPANLPPIEAFRVGTHTDMLGRKHTFTRADLEAACRNYDPALFAAPLVLGHPATDDPAMGWVKKPALRDDGKLVIEETSDVDPAFAELVLGKRFPKVSIALFAKDSPANPTPGQCYIRHLGFLGATAPAVTGLSPVAKFSAASDGVLVFGEFDDMTVAGLFRSVKNFLLVKFGATDKDAVENALPEYMLTSLQINAAQPDAGCGPGFSASGGSPASDSSTPKAGDPMSEELKAAQAAAAAATASAAAAEQRAKEAEGKLAAQAQAARSAQFAAEAATLVNEHKLHPDEVEGFVAFCAQPEERQTIAFAAADGTAKSVNAREWIDRFIKRRGALVSKGEAAAGKVVSTAAPAFAAPADVPVDSGRLDLHQRAMSYASANNCDYVTAVKAVEQA